MQLLNVLAEEVDGDGVLPVAAVPPRQLGSGAVVAEVLLRRVVERVVLSVPPEIGDQMKMTTTQRDRGRERGD